MVKEIQYTSIKRVLDNIMDHPLLRDISLEQAIRYTIRFISLHGYSKLYQDKIEEVDIDDFRGLLPCDLISIIQVKDMRTGVCLRSMTDNFPEGLSQHKHKHKPPLRDHMNNMRGTVPPEYPDHVESFKNHRHWYIPPEYKYMEEPAFKTQGRVIFTTFPKGRIEVAYKAIPVDEHGFPLLIDNENYLAALEAYIKKNIFTIKFDTGKIQAGVLQNAQQEYAWLSGQLQAEFTMPSTSEMESISRSLTNLIPRMRNFDNGFKNLGDREYLRKH